MPFYDYECAACGVFSEFKPMALYQDPQPCPRCRVVSPRVVITAPATSKVPSSVRKARAVNERSARAPRSLTTTSNAGQRSDRRSAPPVRHPPASRPWMLGH
jgi:putative FmdB family regulatory protein